MAESILNQAKIVQPGTRKIKMLLYGNPGVGKTVFSASAPNPYVIDIENGATSLDNHPELMGTPLRNIKSTKEVEDLFWAFRKGEGEQYETVVLDSLSVLSARNLAEHMRLKVKVNPNKDVNLPEQLDYKANVGYIRRTVMNFSELDKHVIFTAHSIFDKDEEDGRRYYRPDVSDSVFRTLVGLMDVIGYMSTETDEKTQEIKRYIQISPSRKITAKTRIGGLDPIILDPRFSMFIKNVAVPTVPFA